MLTQSDAYETAVTLIQACAAQLERIRDAARPLLDDGEHVLVIVDPETELGELMLDKWGIETPKGTFCRMLEMVNVGVPIEFSASPATLVVRIEALPDVLHDAVRRQTPETFGCYTVVIFTDVPIVAAWDPRGLGQQAHSN